ncbi:hypothetical protein BAUCODRAFT_150789 [Baudoinia panamericana UAMH 10762]|uniref:F-box domain-containing protein n=1 Tax=Baudoinia panamericana (strain UAMH 10762) TaxID=717646 RepID=M2N441_BAUPA|nr:uncharacterized protein BAUCODRAFT_150789 [Baudoinia panamericana UAMH 10762]EMC93465.1 hypothetical protein BAUCODRAFT_150789 [Baudoinia panamericana UAMH 10762]
MELEIMSRGIFVLPNEILLSIFNLFPTKSLLPFMPTCQPFHSLILRVLHHRLQVAASLAGHTLYLECYHPSAQLTAAEFFCTSLGTDGLQDLGADIANGSTSIGDVRRAGSLYSRFRPQRKEPDTLGPPKHPAGDIPGSRTYRDPSAALSPEDAVSETVTVDAHELFSQLTTFAYLGKRHSSRGLLFSMQEVCEGTIRVWREWLSRQCESKKWSDGENVVIHHDPPSDAIAGKGKQRSDSVTGYPDPTKDPRILWVNTRDDNVGIRFRVKERKWRRAAPVLFTSDVEVPVSYEIDFEEVFVRTTHLLLKLEEAEQQMDNHSGKAIVFGSHAGLQEYDTAGSLRRR